MRKINLSRWALENQPLVRYLLAVFIFAGVAAFFSLGQEEDPPFVFRGMVVRAYWPGATAMQMGQQVADPIEKVIQEIPYAYKIRSYSFFSWMTVRHPNKWLTFGTPHANV
jgi:multidrug efflux pump